MYKDYTKENLIKLIKAIVSRHKEDSLEILNDARHDIAINILKERKMLGIT